MSAARSHRIGGSVVLAFLVLFYGCSGDRATVATVNGVRITEGQFRNACENRADLSGKKELTTEEKREIVDGLIERELLFQGARAAGVAAKESDIKGRIDEMRGRLGQKEFQGWLKRRGMDVEGLRGEIEKDLIVERFSSFFGKGVLVSAGEVEAYYKAHLQDFTLPPMYRVFILKDYGEEEALDMLARFRRGDEDFDVWALQKAPDDVRRINRSAVLTPAGEFPEEMAAILEKMKPGDIGGPVRKKAGFFIFKLLETKVGGRKSLSEAEADIRHLLTEEKKEESIKNYVTDLRGRAKIETAGRL